MSAAQGTEEWKRERAGHATASNFDKVMAKIRTGEATVRVKYRLQLATERLTGNPVDGYQSAAMLWGIETQPQACMAYEAARGVIVEEVGFLKHPDIAWCGASPDGLIAEDGLVEIKCPDSTTHLATLEAGVIPPEYIAQIQGQMAVTGRQWVDFASFDTRFPENLQLFIVRVTRDEEYIKALETEVRVFLASVDAMVARLMARSSHGV